MDSFLVLAYTIGILALGLSGLHHFVLLVIFLRSRRLVNTSIPPPLEWPSITVQLPIYNERWVVERLIDSVCQLNYPRDRLAVQVLDDSTDETTDIAQARVAEHQKGGVDIQLYHRPARKGYKGGALAEGLNHARGELVAVLDADFVPSPDFLIRLVPYFVHDPEVGMVQARWGHINHAESWITRAQAFSLDAQFVIVQRARYQAGLLVKFNGSGGIWRRECIQDAGGWHSDTLTEDLDLSMRAQMKGWRFLFVPEVVVPAELPSHLAAYKRQQHRWAHGATQVLLKLGPSLAAASIPITARIDGLLQLFAYVNYLIVSSLLLIWLPLLLLTGLKPPSMPWILPLVFAGPLILGLAQWAAYPDWKRRVLYLPVLLLMGVGLGLNNSVAVLSALAGRSLPFVRTPKGGSRTPKDIQGDLYAVPTHWTIWGELGLACYAALFSWWLFSIGSEQTLALGYLALSYGFVGGWGLLEAWRNRTSAG